ncbi:MAG TPA: TetR/AcrR family transcriptional regulator [Acidimicrobiales bacterium]|nr:TetR/AcrR family transcriptional regulator [Acidimicrobiales bacterium]
MNDDALPRTARERGRAELTAHILEVARRHLAEHGAAALSLRAIAREIGMASSAIYRYFPSRDELFTALVIEAYDAIGEVAEDAEEASRRAAPERRWMALAREVRAWARANPHAYALIYGSPVPGYAAPETTVDHAARGPLAMLRIAADGVADGRIEPRPAPKLTAKVKADFAALRAGIDLEVPDAVFSRAFQAWFALFGFITWELFGHLHGVISEGEAADDLFGAQMRAASDLLVGRP